MIPDLDARYLGQAPRGYLADHRERVGDIERQPHRRHLLVPEMQEKFQDM